MAEAFQCVVFLSHSAKDKAVVRPLAERLRGDGPVAASRQSAAFSSERLAREDGEDGGALCRRHAGKIALGTFQLSAFILQPLVGTPLDKKRRFIPLRLNDASFNSWNLYD
jgi:hypothetical protein